MEMIEFIKKTCSFRTVALYLEIWSMFPHEKCVS